MTTGYEFEGIADDLEFMPLAARRALDVAGRKVTLDGWRSLSANDKRALIAVGVPEIVDVARVPELIARAVPPPTSIDVVPAPSIDAVPPDVALALGPSRVISDARWAKLSSLDRYVLWKLREKSEKLARAFDAIVGAPIVLAHLGDSGEARMVGVAAKTPTLRRAIAGARVRMNPEVLARIVAGDLPKGDVLATARIAGIQAAKKTPDLIPLCHPIALTRVEVTFAIDHAAGSVAIRAAAEAVDRTGVEMEAMVAASVAALTIYDMAKSADRWMTIDTVVLLEKSGGKSGDVRRPAGAK